MGKEQPSPRATGLLVETAPVVPIYYYHSVGGKPPQTLATDLFRRHLEAISEHGFKTLTVSELLAGAPTARSCVLTFDDGLMDNFTVVFPLLQEYGFRATFYVVPGYDQITRWVNPCNGDWADLALPGYTVPFESMGAAHRQELAAAGMEIGCHTWSHRKLTQLNRSEWRRELEGARAHLEEELGAPVTSFCYPNGRFNLELLKRVARAGFQGACSTLPGYYRRWSHRYVLPRFLVEDPGFFESVLLGRAFRPGPLSGWLARRLGAS